MFIAWAVVSDTNRMFRYKLTIEYVGTGYCGWQRQEHAISIQETIENAIEAFSQVKAKLFVSGRTDAGVHAIAQVAHFDLPKRYKLHNVQGALNYYLRDSNISIIKAEEVDFNFHARFSAKKRAYIYKICNRISPLALQKNRAWHVRKPLNHIAMREAAKLFEGKHDFSSFRSLECQAKSAVRTIDECRVDVYDELINIIVIGQSFLHNQIRIMTGALAEVGLNRWDMERLQKVLEAKDRSISSATAPPYGLYFYYVLY